MVFESKKGMENIDEKEVLEMSEELENTVPTVEVSEETLNQVQGGTLTTEAVQSMIDASAHQSGVSTKALTLQAGIGTAVGFGSSYVGQIIGHGGKTHKQ